MVDLIQDRLLKMQVLQRVMLKYNVFSDALHGIELLRMFVLYEIYLYNILKICKYFSESALADNVYHLEVVEAKVNLAGSLSPVESLSLRITWFRHDLVEHRVLLSS
jgi:hypothetical protein